MRVSKKQQAHHSNVPCTHSNMLARRDARPHSKHIHHRHVLITDNQHSPNTLTHSNIDHIYTCTTLWKQHVGQALQEDGQRYARLLPVGCAVDSLREPRQLRICFTVSKLAGNLVLLTQLLATVAHCPTCIPGLQSLRDQHRRAKSRSRSLGACSSVNLPNLFDLQNSPRVIETPCRWCWQLRCHCCFRHRCYPLSPRLLLRRA